jgi:hypothetical protein
MSINNCECGSKNFNVMESYAYRSEVDEDGDLVCGKSDGGIDEISCSECGKQFSEDDFNEIIF